MDVLHVHASRPYEVRIHENGFELFGNHIREFFSKKKMLIVCDSNVGDFYLHSLHYALIANQFDVYTFTHSPGETAKNRQNLFAILDCLSGNHFTRNDAIVALGGGVTGDLAGLAAGLYMRGIHLIMIPTSLTAQIDACVGGKNGINLPSGKNLCGTFWQPKLVLVDPHLLHTLPQKYLHDGLSEAIKYGCICNPQILENLKHFNDDFSFCNLINDCLSIKIQIVEQDEFDNKNRKLLNFGHTIGHAIEKAVRFGNISHGEAVGIGMVAAIRLGEKLGLTQEGTENEIIGLLQRFHLPTKTALPHDELISALECDKKTNGNMINMILLSRIGTPFLYPIPLIALSELIQKGGIL